MAMPFELGRTLLVTGQLQCRAKRKALARRHLEEALGIFESLPAIVVSTPVFLVLLGAAMLFLAFAGHV